MNTELKYFDSPFLLNDMAIITKIENHESGMKKIVLDGTIFYPQGGGQPYDQGFIRSSNAEFEVKEVRFEDGIVWHIGDYKNGELKEGDEVGCEVDEERRKLNSRLHSAGHLIDVALANLGYTPYPKRSCHFPGSAYVKYEGELDDENLEAVKVRLEAEMNRLIQVGAAVKMEAMDLEQLKRECRFVPDYLPKDKPSRASVFCFSDEEGGRKTIPCGGTHVAELKDIGKVLLLKLSSKKGETTVGYDLA